MAEKNKLKSNKVADAIALVKQKAHYEKFTKLKDEEKIEYNVKNPTTGKMERLTGINARKRYYERRFNGLTVKIKKEGVKEKAIEILKDFFKLSGKEQAKAAEKTLNDVYDVYVSIGGGGRTKLDDDTKVDFEF